MRRTRVYIISPYTEGDQAANVRASVLIADELASRGYLPFVPLLYHFWHYLLPHPKGFWLDMDLEWLTVCDVVYRHPGDSEGGDIEGATSEAFGLPLYTSLATLYREVTPKVVDDV